MATLVEVVTVRLREMIVSRELEPGARIQERNIAQMLGVSRTPVRLALGILEVEGLVEGEPNCGFVVSDFSLEDVRSAYAVRGALEGLAARVATERRTDRLLDRLGAAVAEGEALLSDGTMDETQMRRWSEANHLFHDSLIEAADLPALRKTHGFLGRMPLAAPTAILFTRDYLDLALQKMREAHFQHLAVLEAVRDGEGARAEYMMREHAHQSGKTVTAVLSAMLR